MSKLMMGTGFSLAVGVVLIAAVACQTPPPRVPAAPDYASELGPKVDAFIQVWNTKDYGQLDALLAADFRRLAPDQNAEGLAGMKEFMKQAHGTYPDFGIVVDEVHYLENLAVVVWTVTGTNTGEGAFPPTGKKIDVQGMTMLRFAGGKITQEVVFYDTATVTGQLGLAAVPHARP